MKELITRALSGVLYITLLILSLYYQNTLLILFLGFGIVCLIEFKKLIQFRSFLPYIIFIVMYLGVGYWSLINPSKTGFNQSVQVLHFLTLLVQLVLINSLFSGKPNSFFTNKPLLLTTFYISSAFVFIALIANYNNTFTPLILLGAFILIWVNDTFAYLIGKNFGKRKLFPSISPKKTIEGFIGGLIFSCIASYFIATFTNTLTFAHWLALSIIVSVFGTLGDLIESKFKRQANVKDSGTIMPGHGGLLDRLDSIIFVAPFFYLYLRLITYVS